MITPWGERVVAPPHTRGSTSATGRRRLLLSGSPAHAGIDLVRMRFKTSRAWLPRTRGDRPPWPVPGRTTASAPPHTRGSTQPKAFTSRNVDGSPAHAGIDPGRDGSTSNAFRLPRTRGDRPMGRVIAECSTAAPPHTRGSTVIRWDHRPAMLGSPAHAGIDPGRALPGSGRGWLPRTRGDRPST